VLITQSKNIEKPSWTSNLPGSHDQFSSNDGLEEERTRIGQTFVFPYRMEMFLSNIAHKTNHTFILAARRYLYLHVLVMDNWMVYDF